MCQELQRGDQRCQKRIVLYYLFGCFCNTSRRFEILCASSPLLLFPLPPSSILPPPSSFPEPKNEWMERFPRNLKKRLLEMPRNPNNSLLESFPSSQTKFAGTLSNGCFLCLWKPAQKFILGSGGPPLDLPREEFLGLGDFA